MKFWESQKYRIQILIAFKWYLEMQNSNYFVEYVDNVPDYERPGISGPIRSIKMYSCIQLCYVKGISVV